MNKKGISKIKVTQKAYLHLELSHESALPICCLPKVNLLDFLPCLLRPFPNRFVDYQDHLKQRQQNKGRKYGADMAQGSKQ